MSIKAEFISHCDEIFEEIRQLDNISSKDILDSLCIDKNRTRVFKAGQGAGKSGSFFFSSYDNRFIIKTLNNKEKKILLSILNDLLIHFHNTENKSLLARIYGLYSLKTNVFGKLNVMVMQYTCNPDHPFNQKMTFDLKGSTVKRLVKLPNEDQLFWRENHNYKKGLKDTNLRIINKDLPYDLISID